jgi:hypothetical protein
VPRPSTFSRGCSACQSVIATGEIMSLVLFIKAPRVLRDSEDAHFFLLAAVGHGSPPVVGFCGFLRFQECA